MRRRRPLVASALFLLGMAAVPALAADHEATLSSAATTFQWEGAREITRGSPLYTEERTAIPCDTPAARPCEEVLIKLAEDGNLTVKVEALEATGSPTDTDVDVYLYLSDAGGEPGEQVASSAQPGPDTVSVAEANAGYYLAVVDYYHSLNGGYKGVATFAPVAPPPAATPTPAPTPTPSGSSHSTKKPSKAACKKKAKKIKNKKKRKKALRKCSKKR